MATALANLVVPEIFSRYYSEEAVKRNAFIRSGIMVNDPALTSMMSTGGLTGNMPFFQRIGGNDEVLSETVALTAGGIEAEKEIYTVLSRGRAWGSNDLAKAFTGEDPMRAIGDMVADWWTEKMQTTIIKTLEGVFSNSSMSGLIHNVTGLGAGKDGIDGNIVIDARQKLGDASNKLTAIVMHSIVYTTLQKEQLIDYVRSADNSIIFPQYLGMNVVVDDTLPYNSGTGVCTSYLFAPGAISYGGNTAPVATELDRDSLTGIDYLITRMHNVFHVRGTKITDLSGLVGITPTNAELAEDRWARIWDVKNMGVIQLVHKNVHS